MCGTGCALFGRENSAGWEGHIGAGRRATRWQEETGARSESVGSGLFEWRLREWSAQGRTEGTLAVSFRGPTCAMRCDMTPVGWQVHAGLEDQVHTPPPHTLPSSAFP